MAIRINTTLAGIEVGNAYARIEDFNGTKEGMDISLVYYVNQEACQNGEAAFKRDQHHFIPDVRDSAANYHKQGYAYVKSQEGFEDAIDC